MTARAGNHRETRGQHYGLGGLVARERAGTLAALVRCRAIVEQLVKELDTTTHEQFDLMALTEFYASLEHAAEVLEQKTIPREK
jgi:hypothetical protein